MRSSRHDTIELERTIFDDLVVWGKRDALLTDDAVKDALNKEQIIKQYMRSSLRYALPSLANHQTLAFQNDPRGMCALRFSWYFCSSLEYRLDVFQVLLRRAKSVEGDTDKSSSGNAALQTRTYIK